MTGLIRVLSQEVANRIAAGEVIERPSAVVKELLENALDAGARRLELELEEGGVRLIRLRDDGQGMHPEDLERCVLAHATSKIASVEDLFQVASFGFRGEALPSIVSVSETSILSRREGDELGARLTCRPDGSQQLVPAGAPVGTTVEVRNLFANVPARRKFLKQERTELAHCLEAVTRLLLPEPDVAIRVTHNKKHVLEVKDDAGRRERIRTFFGEKTSEPLLDVEAGDASLRLEAFVGPCDLVRHNTRQQYLFLNGRYVKDRSLSFALKDAYRGLIMPRDHPVAFLFLEMDPAEVDVNVHPTKTEVRFKAKDRVYALVRNAVRSALMEATGDRPLRVAEAERESGTRRRSAPPASPSRGDLLARIENELFPDGTPPPETSPPPERVAEPGPDVPWPVAPQAEEKISATARSSAGGRRCRGAQPQPGPAGAAGGAFLQLHASYIVEETPQGFRIVDQHALHERKLFEELRARFRAAEVETQQLLVPEVVELGAADQTLLLGWTEELAAFGLQVEPFGGTSICVRSIPTVLARATGESLVRDVLEVLQEDGARLSREELIMQSLANIACRAAVKFNDRLPEAEIEALLAWAEAHPEARNCPHGRPIAVSLSLRELEDQFMRKR